MQNKGIAGMEEKPNVVVAGNATPEADSVLLLLHEKAYSATLIDIQSVPESFSWQAVDLFIIALDHHTTTFIAGLRRAYSKSDLPILLLCNPERFNDYAQIRDQAILAGANDILEIPYDDIPALARIDSLLVAKAASLLNSVDQQYLQQEVRSRTAKLDMLIENGLMMSAERDRNKLLKHLLVKGQRLLNCDAGTMYLVTDHNTLRFALRTKEDELPTHEIPLYDPVTGAANEAYVSTYTALHNEPVLIDDVYQETRFDLSGTRAFDAATNYRTLSMLTVPMAPRNGEVIGVLQFMNVIDPQTGAIVPFSPEIVGLVVALASQAAMALDNLQLVEAQAKLMESMIRVIATAIDAKSPYTGRHCERVPELAFMLAEAACETNTGSLAEFNFSTEDEWQEFRIGAWLHDCGKVTTPEYVIDKSTKLETIHNRLHEIRMRFEVLLRDADIARLQSLLEGNSIHDADAVFARRAAELQGDFAFIAECNLGSETMDASRVDRVKEIAARTWLRHFDDKLGISFDEHARYEGMPSASLPVVEPLLADKPQHIVQRPPGQVLDPDFGFQIDVPEHLYNYGEIYNLCIRRGTLTQEERYKINEHMIQGIMMLERMNFPKSLRRVPEYAGTHHETLDGTGYPRRLTADQLSIPARIMAIVDIFEALTAADRPYKKPKRLSEALSILHAMKTGGRIDADLFDLFLTSGVYMRYAQQYLQPEQIDEVDIREFLDAPADSLQSPVKAA